METEHPAQPSGALGSTTLRYLYRAALTGTTHGTFTFSGRITEEEKAVFAAALHGGRRRFIAEQVGLPALGELPRRRDDDPTWHEFDGWAEDEQPPDTVESIGHFVARFTSAEWDPTLGALPHIVVRGYLADGYLAGGAMHFVGPFDDRRSAQQYIEGVAHVPGFWHHSFPIENPNLSLWFLKR